MKNVAVVIALATAFALFFQITVLFEMPDGLIFSLFFISPFVVLAMVYSILKYGIESKHTWDERFYDDWNYQRNGEE